MSVPRILCAPWVLPGEDAAIRDGAVVVRGGDVLDVGGAGDILPRHAGARVEKLDGVLGPGLVNAHTHLELTGLRGKVAGGRGFLPWVDTMLGLRAAERPEDDDASVSSGVREIERAGTVAVGEVTNTLAAAGELVRRRIGGIVFVERFGMDPEIALEGVRGIEIPPPAGDLVFSPAPHTVYTTHPDAVRALAAMARERGTRISVHLAEHSAERTFLETRGGPFAEFAKSRRFDSPAFPCFAKGPIDVADELGLLAPDVLLVHLTDAHPDEIRRIAERGCSVVVCPGSNLYIQGQLPPLLAMLEVGIVPALGTDSLASNVSLDVLREARTLAERFPAVPGSTLFRMATSAGARALGRPDLGRIAKGTRPGILLFDGDAGDDPYALALRAPPRRRIVDREGAA